VYVIAAIWLSLIFPQVEEGKKGPESNVDQITAGKEAIAKAKTAKREIA